LDCKITRRITMLARRLLPLGAAAALLVVGLSPASAQSSSTQPPSTETPSSAAGQGTTSGPAAGTPTTMGTSGTTAASPHQLEGVKDKGSSVTRETEQTVGSGSNQAPRGAAGVKGAEGGKSGPTAGETADRAKQ
jgi:hypothetical protein